MDWQKKKKVANNTSRLFFLTVLLVTAYWLYSKYKTENLTEYESQNSHMQPKVADSVTSSSQLQASVLKKIDTIKVGGDSQLSFEVHVSPYAQQSIDSSTSDSSTFVPVTLHQKSNVEKIVADKNSAVALQGPSALFSRTYTIGIGKTIPVNILWSASSGAEATHYKLVSVKADDIAGKKARFTIEDPFNVLLFSQTGYAASDKIIIKDERHDINILVLEVNANSVVIKVESRLNESIVNKLKKAA